MVAIDRLCIQQDWLISDQRRPPVGARSTDELSSNTSDAWSACASSHCDDDDDDDDDDVAVTSSSHRRPASACVRSAMYMTSCHWIGARITSSVYNNHFILHSYLAADTMCPKTRLKCFS